MGFVVQVSHINLLNKQELDLHGLGLDAIIIINRSIRYFKCTSRNKTSNIRKITDFGFVVQVSHINFINSSKYFT